MKPLSKEQIKDYARRVHAITADNDIEFASPEYWKRKSEIIGHLYGDDCEAVLACAVELFRQEARALQRDANRLAKLAELAKEHGCPEDRAVIPFLEERGVITITRNQDKRERLPTMRELSKKPE